MKIGAVLREILVSSQTSTQFAHGIRETMAAQTDDLQVSLDSADVFRGMVVDISTGARAQEEEIRKILENLGALRNLSDHFTRMVEDRALDTRRLLENKDRIKQALQAIANSFPEKRGVPPASPLKEEFDRLRETTAQVRSDAAELLRAISAGII